MEANADALRILTRYVEVGPFVARTVEAADTDKDALGFFPASVFEEFARKDQLFVAVVRESDEFVYAGHLLFNARPPKAHVRQIFVLERYRRLRLGTRLLDELKGHLTELQFISVHARVAEDLGKSNVFWEGQDFYTQRVVPGGSSRNRMIVVRSHELSTPQLFASSGISQADPFGLNIASQNETPLFLLDLNVLFDLGRRRSRHEDVVAVFRAERMQACQLAISSELDAELARTASPGKTDPMLDLTSILPKFATPPEEEWAKLALELGPMVFSKRHRNGVLSANDLSDLRHLATAIFHGLQGLVTSDSSVLDAAAALRERFGIQVLSPAAFTLTDEVKVGPGIHGVAPNSVLVIEVMESAMEPEVRELLSRLDVSRGAQAAEWAAVNGNSRVCHRYIVRVGVKIVSYLVCPNAIRGALIDARVAVDEGSPVAADAARLMIGHLTEQAAATGTVRIRLKFPVRQVVVREVADALGFTGSSDNQTELQKVALNGILTTENWANYRDSLLAASDVRLPDHPPVFRNVDQQIQIHRPDGNRVHLPLLKLESYLSPALFCLPGRSATLTPLRREYAEHLLRHLPQQSLLPQARAQLYGQRHFINGQQARATFSRGGLILFYESGKGQGVGAVVAVARVVHSYHRDEDSMNGEDLNPSVLEAQQLSSIGKSRVRTVTVFDNLLTLPKAVSLDVLKRLGCGTPNQLITSRRLSSDQTQGILVEGLK